MPKGANVVAPAAAAKFLRALERRYSPNQPRVPAGSRQGGEWTSGGGGGAASPSSDAEGAAPLDQVALNVDPNLASDDGADPGDDGASIIPVQSRLPIDLSEEDANGGHTKRHVGKKDDELLAEIESERTEVRTPFGLIVKYKPAIGSFDSIESANDFVNRTLEANKSFVDAVAEGRLEFATLERIFGYRTGKEAYLESGIAQPIIQRTYAVRVVIHADPNSARGYRVRTAFPFNLH